MEEIKVVVVVGPTASGKSQLAIDIATQFDGEIISGDSMQIYRGMNIGTAKVTTEEMAGIPHYLIDICEPTQTYSVAQFQHDVRQLISDIHHRGKLPIIAGGTGLYIQAVLMDYHFDEQRDTTLREQLQAQYAQTTNDDLHAVLATIDWQAAQEIHPNNRQRIIRALEMAHSGQKKSAVAQAQKMLYDARIIGLDVPRELLNERINMRVDTMVDLGLINEVRDLYEANVLGETAVKAIGYQEFIPYFAGQVSEAFAIEQVKIHSRRYAKRQMTWFKNQKLPIEWFEMTPEVAVQTTQAVFNYLRRTFQAQCVGYDSRENDQKCE
ncbi:MAG: tRNA (adenosine(37)-N6)-dimethylallyltransferase MiaA [Culicoidibacterales bacterium]